MINDTGYLEIILGPMWSGKTTELVKLYNKFKFCDINILTINYLHDTRYSENNISTHDKISIPCLMVENLKDISDILNDKLTEIFNESQVILINEGQFFKDINEWVDIAVNKYNKHIYICGLDGDSNQNKFGNILDLIPKADNIVKLSSICAICKNGTPAPFTIRLSNETTQVVIGVNNYKPVCRKCLQKLNC